MDSLDKTATDKVNLLKAFNGVTETLKVVQDAVKDDPALNKKVIEATEAYTKNSSSLTELLNLASKCRRENDIHADIKEPPSHTEREHVAIEDEKAKEEPTRAAIAIDDQPDVQTELIPASKEVCPDPDAPILMPYEINGKIF
ncbi:hypothetical protein Tco_0717758 [Tanacetum coccineum]